MFISGFYCYNVKTADAIEVVITTKTVGGEVEATEATVSVTKDAGVASVALTHFEVANPTAQTPVEDKVPVGKWLAVAVTCADGYEVASVQVNGSDLMFMSGFYCYNVKTADAFEVVITTRAIA